MRKDWLVIIISLVLGCVAARAQSPLQDSTNQSRDTLLIAIPADSDTLPQNPPKTVENKLSPDDLLSRIKISKDAVEKEITYAALDSNITLVDDKEIRLYTKARVNYESFKMEADVIVLNFKDHTLKGFALMGPDGQLRERASFDDGDSQGTFREMAYNYETEKAFVKSLKTKEGEFTINGERSKFISEKNDTIHHEARFFNEDAIISTCNLDHPHFGIRTKRLKFIPDKLAVLGPAQLELGGVPTPVILPYGFLPLIKGQSSGLIFPNNYEYNERYGFGLREVGYYFPINDYVDLKLTGDIYTRGAHAVRAASNYKKRYAYSGFGRLEYSNLREEDSEGIIKPNRTFSISLSHNQDAKAHPYRTIGGSISISGNQHNRRNYFDANSALTNTYRSSFSFNYTFPDSPFKFSMGVEHHQNTDTRDVRITLPTANLTMRTIQPFKRKNRIGGDKWYESINLSYAANIKNFTKTTDTTLLTQEVLDNLVSGLSHEAKLSFNTRALKYFTVSPFVNYREVYNVKTVQRVFDPSLILDTISIDTTLNIVEIDTTFGSVSEDLVNDLQAFRRIDAGITINTQLFATKTWKKGKIRGIRHIMKPTVSFNFLPDTRSRYQEFVQTDLRPEFNTLQAYNPFPTEPFGVSLSDPSMGLNWNINNTLEAKTYSKKDSTIKKIKLLENVRISGSYNFIADSMRWSRVTLTGNTRLFKGISTLSYTFLFTPYELENGTKEINQYVWHRKKIPLQMLQLSGNFNSGISIRDMIDIVKGKPVEKKGPAKQVKSSGPPSLIGLIENFQVRHNLVFNVSKTPAGRDSLIISVHTLGIQGNLKLTDKWSITLGNISYNLLTKKPVYPSMTFNRDLHCWTMSIGWYPSSQVYNFYIGVKSSSLSFIKYDYGQNTFGPSGVF